MSVHGRAESMARRDSLILSTFVTHPEWAPSIINQLERSATNGCAIWTRWPSTEYGATHLPGSWSTQVKVHRVIWLWELGPIPYGHVLDHDGPNGCHNRRCANTEHLVISTNFANTVTNSDSPFARNARKTHCPSGHPLVEPNLNPRGLSMGIRSCRSCGYARSAIAGAKAMGRPYPNPVEALRDLAQAYLSHYMNGTPKPFRPTDPSAREAA